MPVPDHPDRLDRRGALFALASLLAARPLQAAEDAAYPTRAITMLLPYAPGGMGDVFARVVAERMTAAWKQPVVVDNRPGAGGAVGTRIVAKAAPDGYTLLLGQTGEMVINPIAMKQPGYDAQHDFRPVVLVGDAPLVLVVPPASPLRTIADLKAALVARPGQLSFASPGLGTPAHLAGAAFGLACGAPAVHVPYKGGGPAMNDLLGGQVDFFFAAALTAKPHVQAGTARGLAVSSLARMKALPDIPTVAETIAPGFSFSIWGGLFAPAQTPDALVAKLNRELNRILTEPGVIRQLEDQGAALKANTPAEFGGFVQRERDKYALIVRQTGVHLD